LLPIGLFVLNKAANESAIFDKEKYQKVVERIGGFFKKKFGFQNN